MEFRYQQDPCTFLTANGLGGYCSVFGDGSVRRCDQGILVSAEKIPNLRITLVHRLRERLEAGGKSRFLSSQSFADGTAEAGCWKTFTYDRIPRWETDVKGVRIVRTCGMEENATAVCYELTNETDRDCVLTLEPLVKLAPKEEALKAAFPVTLTGNRISGNGWGVYLHTDGELLETKPRWEWLAYPEDAKDGRPDRGLAGSCCIIRFAVGAGEKKKVSILFSQTDQSRDPWEICANQVRYLMDRENQCGLADPVARQLAGAADAFIVKRQGGRTILAGYPLFSDWGRDTMIALRGCCLTTRRFADAKSILRTFLANEKDGLMPNLFPEGEEAPLYNTVDAALLFVDAVWQYYGRTGDREFVLEAWPVMNRIIRGYLHGTHHNIGMDDDGLIHAGEGLDQVTWMDVRIGDILPTPRHGKPVEVNAYWYNALRIMEQLASLLGKPGGDFGKLADRVRESFTEKFYIPEKGYLKDVLSGTEADEQIRCNQIWAVSMAFTMLTPDQEKSVVDTVKKHLFTEHGLRSLSPEDPQYHPHYGGDQRKRDLAYHQGTVWVFPLGAFYLAYLKVYGKSGAAQVRKWLSSMEEMLREGCAGQLPEIYDGDDPQEGKGCFAQAWSVGEMLTVYEALEELEHEKKPG